jgi:hypothetical protein
MKISRFALFAIFFLLPLSNAFAHPNCTFGQALFNQGTCTDEAIFGTSNSDRATPRENGSAGACYIVPFRYRPRNMMKYCVYSRSQKLWGCYWSAELAVKWRNYYNNVGVCNRNLREAHLAQRCFNCIE